MAKHTHWRDSQAWHNSGLTLSTTSNEACQLYDAALTQFAHDSYFYLGKSIQIRDSIARVMPYWIDSIPLSSYLHGMYAFGLEETNLYSQAETEAKLGLQLNPNDAWATHSLAHVLEMTGRADEGIKFMNETHQDWNICGMISCHIYWHWALYCIENGNYDKAMDIYDTYVEPCSRQSGVPLDMVDSSSLLYRLTMEGVTVGKERWQNIFDNVKPHLDDHTLVFNDVHYMMAALGAKHEDVVTKFKDTIQEFIHVKKGDQRDIMNEVGLVMIEALEAYDREDFAEVVDKMLPVRYLVINIGGSHAQRDIFNQFLIHAARKSSETHHQSLARCLIVERKSLKKCAPLTDRMTTLTIVP